jgi:Sulfotransferase family
MLQLAKALYRTQPLCHTSYPPAPFGRRRKGHRILMTHDRKDHLGEPSILWLVVGGAPRSGTTLVQQILNSHPHIVCLHEFGLHRFVTILDQLFSVEEERDAWLVPAAAKVAKRLAESRRPVTAGEESYATADRPWSSMHEFAKFRYDFTRQEIDDPELIPRRKDAIDIYRSVLAAVSRKNQIRVCADKTPGSLIRDTLPALETKLGSIKRLYIVRDPVATIESSVRRARSASRGEDQWHISSVEEAIVEWAENWELVAREAREANNALILRYEDLVADFTVHASRIAAFCEVEDKFTDLVMPTPEELREPMLSVAERALIEQQLGALATEWQTLSLTEAFERFATIFLSIEPGTPIEANGPASSLVFKEGFAAPEDFGRWTLGHRARFAFRLLGADAADIWVEMKFVSPRFLAGRSQVILTVNGGAPQLLQIPQPDDQPVYAGFICRSQGGLVDCTIHMPNVKRATDEPVADTRELGLGFVQVSATLLSPTWRDTVPRSDAVGESGLNITPDERDGAAAFQNTPL